MATFSQRNGYTEPSTALIREEITPEIQNAICNCFFQLQDELYKTNIWNSIDEAIEEMEKEIWAHFLNADLTHFHDRRGQASPIAFIKNPLNAWHLKLDLIEFMIGLLRKVDSKNNGSQNVADWFVDKLNFEFKRLNFAYSIINNLIVPITDEQEIKAIENAMQASTDNIKMHLSKALELYAKRPNGDYRNSIKESISAVEAYCRERTNTKTLGDALNSLASNGMVIPEILKLAFEKLYAYTNQSGTGIRHSLMGDKDDKGKYTPKEEEAIFMHVACSAFINYLRRK